MFPLLESFKLPKDPSVGGGGLGKPAACYFYLGKEVNYGGIITVLLGDYLRWQLSNWNSSAVCLFWRANHWFLPRFCNPSFLKDHRRLSDFQPSNPGRSFGRPLSFTANLLNHWNRNANSSAYMLLLKDWIAVVCSPPAQVRCCNRCNLVFVLMAAERGAKEIHHHKHLIVLDRTITQKHITDPRC